MQRDWPRTASSQLDDVTMTKRQESDSNDQACRLERHVTSEAAMFPMVALLDIAEAKDKMNDPG